MSPGEGGEMEAGGMEGSRRRICRLKETGERRLPVFGRLPWQRLVEAALPLASANSATLQKGNKTPKIIQEELWISGHLKP